MDGEEGNKYLRKQKYGTQFIIAADKRTIVGRQGGRKGIMERARGKEKG